MPGLARPLGRGAHRVPARRRGP
ncbi:hypothetical protein M4914_00205 [Streptomyces somaliensis DSM 40738]|nr:hypothetical protein [Streptomyces somaliensis DSM 40738]